MSLYTMPRAKCLEWPIAAPIDTMIGIMAPKSPLTDRDSDTFYRPMFGVKPVGYEAARGAEKAVLDRERICLPD